MRSPHPIRREKFRDLIRRAFAGQKATRAPGHPSSWRLSVLADVRRELEVCEAEVERGWSEDESVSRMALARAVYLLRELDRSHYQEGP